MNRPYNCLVVLGPTASGKTRLACEIAFHLHGEIISADSRQVYKRLDIGTGKDLDLYKIGGTDIPFHLIDVREPQEQFYLHDFARGIKKAFDEILSRRNLPVFCGGTGLYLDALRNQFELTQVPVNNELRRELEPLGRQALLERLLTFPPSFIEKVDRTSRKRMIRGIEIAGFLANHCLRAPEPLPYKPFYIGVAPSREVTLRNIGSRLTSRLENGMVEEVKALLDSGIRPGRLAELGLEYKYVTSFLEGRMSFSEMYDKLFIAIRQFAKRQMTWFRRMEKQGVEIYWQDSPLLSADLLNKLRELLPA